MNSGTGNNSGVGSNVNSSSSITTNVSVWLKSIPLMTRSSFLLCSFLYLCSLLFGSFNPEVCLVSFLVVNQYQVWRIFSSAWFHMGILHILLNMMSFLPLGSSLEKTLGTIRYAYLILLVSILNSFIHIFISYLLFYNPFYSTSFIYECSVGFSGVIFTLLVINLHSSTEQTRSLFGIIKVPSSFYAWVLLVVLQLIMPGVSFLGHLSGIISGYLYNFGYLNKLFISNSIINSLETSNALGFIVSNNGFISNPSYGLPTQFPPQNSPSSSTENSLFTRLRSSIPSFASNNAVPSSSTELNKNFPGKGHTLASSNQT